MKYTIKSGDTLAGIAGKYTLAKEYYIGLANLNNIANPNVIYAGQVIDIPDNWLKPEYRGTGNESIGVMIQPSSPTAPTQIRLPTAGGGGGGGWGSPTQVQQAQAAMMPQQSGMIFGLQPQTLLIAGIGVILLAALMPSKESLDKGERLV